MEPSAKGTVTPIASLFSAEEARKAASYVEEKIREKREEMNRLQGFVDENDNLINLVKKLPDQLHHNIMVPFGKLAFFPGRLIHTNECLVLLGENYYTDRTSKQTVEVLRRRDETLQYQIHSLKAEIEDFKAEASFFSTTASEVAEGLVEIREEYDEEEEESSASVVRSGEKEHESAEGQVEDDEFARIMSRLNELEIEEEQEGEEHDSPRVNVEEKEHDMVNRLGAETEKKRTMGQEATIGVPKKVSGDSSYMVEPKYAEPSVRKKVTENPYKDLNDPKPQYVHKEDQLRRGTPQQNAGTRRDLQATSAVTRENAKPNIESPMQKPKPKFDSSKAFTGLIVEHTENLGTLQPNAGTQRDFQVTSAVSKANAKPIIESPIEEPEPKFDSSKAFTGAIVERTGTNPYTQMQSSGSQSSRPVSRFKAQRK